MQLNSVFKDWLTVNKITENVQNTFGIYFKDDAIVIPVHDIDGSFIFNKYRRSPLSDQKPKYWYDNGGKVTLYGYDKAKHYSKILITEGEKDCLVAWSHNIPAVTSTGGAQSFQRAWADLFKDKEVIVCFDNDEAGGVGMAKVVDMIPHAKVLFLPDDTRVKDISDYVMCGGNFDTLITTAQHFSSLADVANDRITKIAKWQSTFFHDAYRKLKVTQITPKTQRVKHDADEIKNARLYPVTNLLEFKQNKVCCPFHNENTPSLHYYEKSNSCYCFGGCGRAYDAIDIFRKINNCTFKEAIEQLNRLV